MKTKILSILLILALAVPLTAAPPAKQKSTAESALIVDNTSWIDANNIFMFVTNHGNFARDLTDMFGQDAGTFFPYTGLEDLASGAQNDYVNYASGLWIGGLVGGETRIAIAEYSDEYVPGPMTGTTFSTDSPDFHVFKLYKDSLAANPNQDYLDWNIAAQQGAPFTVVDGDTVPDEVMIGNQMLWSVYNDADPDQHTNDAGETAPLGLEVRQTTFAFDREDPLGNIIFIKLQVYNRGGNTINNCYFSLWADPDLGGAGDDLVGCDTALSLGYVYNATNADSHYGSQPPSLGYDFFQGPLVFTDNDADTGKGWGQLWPGYKNLGMVSFNKYINGTDPNNFGETYNYMQGLEATGDPYVTTAGDTTLYFHAGDPVAGEGDLDTDPADRRFMQSTGPVTFGPNDTTEILAAIIVGQGSDRLSSISVMKYYDQFAQSAYDIDFQLPDPPSPPVVTVEQLNGEVSLYWTDLSETDHGDFDFQGYTVYQGESAAGPWKRIANYDINDGVGTILDDFFDVETSTLEYRGVKFGSDTGVKRYFSTKQDFLIGGKLNDETTYYYKVEAYSYDPDATPKTLTSARIVTATPQPPLAGLEYSMFNGDTIVVTHNASGGSDGSVWPIVLDPGMLNGHTYRVIFKLDTTGTYPMLWDLYDVTTGTRLLADQANQTGDDDYIILDGMIVKVSGPPQGVADWDIPNGTRRFTWANADGFGFEGFEGALGWGGPGDTHGFGSFDPIDPTTLPAVLLKLDSVAADGTFDSTGENVSKGYRYLRSPGAPARPEFGPYIVDPNPPGGSYGYQDFARSVPLSAWNVDVDPPQRLVVGYLENNQINGLVDGKYWPGFYNDYNNTAGDGPREWLWIYQDTYSETPNPNYQLNAIDDYMPVMYWALWNRRAEVAWEDVDEFLIIPNYPNSPVDTFTFVATAPTVTANNAALDDIRVVPNPFYLYSSYDPEVGNNVIKFTHLPETCKISIYNLAGEYVDMVEKDDPTTSIAIWNGNTFNGLPIASGVYIYVVDAEGYGQKVGKFAVFKEIEVLKKF